MAVVNTSNVQSWDEVEEQKRGDFPALEPGLYDAYLFGWEKKISSAPKSKGEEYYRPEFVVDQDGAPKAHVWGYWDTRSGRGYMKRDCNAIGIDLAGLDIDDAEGLETRLDEAVTRQPNCRLRLRKTTYQGKGEDEETGEEIPVAKEKNEIRAILPAR